MVSGDTVLFLGAGFSADACLPVLSDFARAADLADSDLVGFAESDPPKRLMARELVAAARSYERFRDACLESGAVSESDAGNIETVFCLAEALREVGYPQFELEGTPRPMKDIVADIELWIWKTYHRLPFFDRKKNPRGDTYATFFDLLRTHGLAERTTFITTNYDVVFEWTAWDAGFASEYPISRSVPLNAGTGTERFVAPVHPSRTSLPLFKLHGSINYFVEGPESGRVSVSANLSDGNLIGLSQLPIGCPAVVAVDVLADLRGRSGADGLRPAIIPPSYGKLAVCPWQQEIWRGAFDALRTARYLVFIGYSFPLTDGPIRALMSGSLATRPKQGMPQVFVIDGKETVHENFRKFFPGLVQDTDPAYLADANKNELPTIFQRIRESL